jgi:hypothetical protein
VELILKILAALPLLKSSKEAERRKNLRLIKRTRKQLYRLFKKDGFTEEETEKIKEVDTLIINAIIHLNKF